MRLKLPIKRHLAVSLAAFATAGCGLLDVPSTNGTTRVLLTDAPFPYDKVQRVDLFVVSVSGSLGTDTSATASFFTLAAPNRKVNVMSLQNGAFDVLGLSDQAPGQIQAVRMVIDTDSSSITLKDGRVFTGKTNPGIAWQSSAGRPTLNALVQDVIMVTQAGATVILDVDVGKTVLTPQDLDPASTAEGFTFSPLIRAIELERASAITGTVRSGTGGGPAVANASLRLYLGNPAGAENTWSVIATTRTLTTGAFAFAYVPRSGLYTQPGVTYIVAVDPPAGSGLGRKLIPNVSTTAGAETAMGIVILP